MEGEVSGAQDVQVPGAELDAGILTVPEFEPLPDGMFRRELEPMLKEARKARARVESCAGAYVWKEQQREGYEEDVAWYRNELASDGLAEERRTKLEREFWELEEGRLVRIRGAMKAQAVAVLGAWSRRIEELEKALAGVKR